LGDEPGIQAAASAPAEQFPARFEHRIDINLAPLGKLTRAQRFENFDALPAPRLQTDARIPNCAWRSVVKF
jgi:hypothetical protein